MTTIMQICDAISETLGEATGVSYVQSYDEISEAINDWPLLQTYAEEWELSANSRTDRRAFQGGVRQEEFLIHVDLYGRQRSHLMEDMKKITELVNAIRIVFKQQDTKPYFNLAGIKAFKVLRSRRVMFQYGDPQVRYIGWRFPIAVTVSEG